MLALATRRLFLVSGLSDQSAYRIETLETLGSGSRLVRMMDKLRGRMPGGGGRERDDLNRVAASVLTRAARIRRTSSCASSIVSTHRAWSGPCSLARMTAARLWSAADVRAMLPLAILFEARGKCSGQSKPPGLLLVGIEQVLHRIH